MVSFNVVHPVLHMSVFVNIIVCLVTKGLNLNVYCGEMSVRLTLLFSPCTNKANHSSDEANKENDRDESKCNDYVEKTASICNTMHLNVVQSSSPRIRHNLKVNFA